MIVGRNTTGLSVNGRCYSISPCLHLTELVDEHAAACTPAMSHGIRANNASVLPDACHHAHASAGNPLVRVFRECLSSLEKMRYKRGPYVTGTQTAVHSGVRS